MDNMYFITKNEILRGAEGPELCRGAQDDMIKRNGHSERRKARRIPMMFHTVSHIIGIPRYARNDIKDRVYRYRTIVIVTRSLSV